MGLSVALNNALTGLTVNQQQLTVLSQNIANANTPGYSKQSAQQDAIYLSGVGQGVNITQISRKVDDYLTRAVQTQGSVVANTGVLTDYSARIQLLLGNPGDQNSIDAYINTFSNSVQSLAQTPTNTTLQQTAVNNGITLASQISGLATSLQNLQYQADQDVAQGIAAVNVDLKRVADLNQQISTNIGLGKSVAELQDSRDKAIADMSQYINVSTFTQKNGTMSLTTGNGIPILDNSVYQFYYKPAASADSFGNGGSLASITLNRLDSGGNVTGTPVLLANAGQPGGDMTTGINSVFNSGKIAALMNIRDTQIPAITSQLDNLASNLRDQMNTIHNTGSGYPGANSFTGTRAVYAQQVNQWSGQARIAVLDSNGQPIKSPYADEPNGYAPLTLDLEKMDTQSGVGNPSVQGIVDALNQYYGTPQNKMELGNLNNIQMVSDNTSLPSSPPKFNFDFNLNNISGTSAGFFVNSVTVQNNNGVDISSVTSSIPKVDLAPINTYVTSQDSNVVTVNTATTSNLSNGEVVYLSTPPGGPYDGLTGAQLGGYFTISNVSANSFQITVAGQASNGTNISVASQTANPPYTTATSGGDTRTSANGLISADLTADPTSPFYTISVSLGVDDGSGVIKTSVVSYRVNNQQPNALNKAIGAQSFQGSGSIVSPVTTAPLAVAKLVDAQGKELPKVNGIYTNNIPGYLQITAGSSTSTIAIDSLNSAELGNPTVSPAISGSNRGFSHYFDLNDFFKSNDPTNTGDTVAGSAANLAVETRFKTNPGLLSLGQMIKSPDSLNTNVAPNYTYQLNPGDNSIITKLSQLTGQNLNFVTAGGLGATSNTFTGYAAQIIGSASANAATAKTTDTNANALLQGYQENSSAISGVNLDTELANTVIYQNAYTASARVITVANQLFDTLLNTFQP